MVFGAGSRVGRLLIEVAAGTGRDMVGLTHCDVDICDASAVTAAVAEHAPSSIVNAAAYTAVDKAESEQDRAFEVNRDGAAWSLRPQRKRRATHSCLDRLRVRWFEPSPLRRRRSGQSARHLIAALKNTYYGRNLETVAHEARRQY